MKQGEIYLVRFPFTDLTSTKLRPAILISNSSFNKYKNNIFIGIFGNKGISEYSLKCVNSNLQEGRLNKDSYLRFQNIFSLHEGLIVKKVGRVQKNFLKDISLKMNNYIKIDE